MLRIVIADDEHEARDNMVQCINKYTNGIEIIGIAGDGNEAYDLILELMPDIVMIDIQMPGMTGLEVIEKIRSKNLQTAFIIISSYGDFEFTQAAINLKVEAYLLKPFLPVEVCKTIYRAAEQIASVKNLPFFTKKESLQQAPTKVKPGMMLSNSRMPLVYPYNEEKRVIECLKLGDNNQLTKALDNFFKMTSESNLQDTSVLNCFVIVYVGILHEAMNLGIKYSTLSSPVMQNSSGDEEDFKNIIKETAFEVLERLKTPKSSNSIISRALQYIDENYAEHLSLDEVASKIFVSPNYLSGLFIQSIGVHFTDYIHNVRITQSKIIIENNPHLKNYEISEMVGYQSVKYFSKIFKKINNVTVSEYRNNLGFISEE